MVDFNITPDNNAIDFKVKPISLFLVGEAVQRQVGATDFITLPVFATDAGNIELLVPNTTVSGFDTASSVDNWTAAEAGGTLKDSLSLGATEFVQGKIIRTPLKDGSPPKQYFLVQDVGVIA
jgi:hypothetical protein